MEFLQKKIWLKCRYRGRIENVSNSYNPFHKTSPQSNPSSQSLYPLYSHKIPQCTVRTVLLITLERSFVWLTVSFSIILLKDRQLTNCFKLLLSNIIIIVLFVSSIHFVINQSLFPLFQAHIQHYGEGLMYLWGSIRVKYYIWESHLKHLNPRITTDSSQSFVSYHHYHSFLYL